MRCSRSRCIIILFLIFAIFALIFWKFYQEITLQELILVHYISDVDGNQELPSGSNCTIRSIVEESMYAVNAAEDACFIIPGFDTLNMDRFHAGQRSPLKNFNAVAATTSFKNNVLLFVFAGANILDEEFLFFIVVPIKSAISHNVKMLLKSVFNCADCLVIDDCVDNNVDNCNSHITDHDLDAIIQRSEFTLIDDRVAGYEFFSMTFYRSRLSSVQSILRLLSFQRKQQMREQISFVYERYFSSLQKIVLTTLKILERRIISNSFVTYDAWNRDPRKQRDLAPLFLPYHAHSDGFTAVILTYNKPDSLFSVIRLLSRVRSLRSIVIVWNHWSQPPPGCSPWRPAADIGMNWLEIQIASLGLSWVEQSIRDTTGTLALYGNNVSISG
ncbi:unnamed protein product [Gongylonema pulchrum]|uniref:Glyco_transf_64 domain-containing protein n=1 Tax=Gongylonema pulchrum TaxID=637853 RepID=A0A183DZ87_9BILA|nr:unnamed protein product [Gongylonema pulchrum]